MAGNFVLNADAPVVGAFELAVSDLLAIETIFATTRLKSVALSGTVKSITLDVAIGDTCVATSIILGDPNCNQLVSFGVNSVSVDILEQSGLTFILVDESTAVSEPSALALVRRRMAVGLLPRPGWELRS